MHFQWLIEETEAVFKQCLCNKINLPGRFSSIQHDEHDGVLTLENHFYQINEVGQLRTAHTYAPKINIIAIFFFPEPNFQLPVYSMEFVILGEKPIVALMDMVCLVRSTPISDDVKRFMTSVHSQYPEFSQTEILPEWFEQCRSGFEFFFRPNQAEDFKTLSKIHLLLLKNLTQLLEKSEKYDEDKSLLHKANLDAYKLHHKINSPGLRLMNRSFGSEWTQEYLTSHLFV
jgi:phycocyanobilin:ferredoxin oxidoreductase